MVKRRGCVSLLSKDTLVNLLGNLLSAEVRNQEEAEGVNKEHFSSTDQACDLIDIVVHRGHQACEALIVNI